MKLVTRNQGLKKVGDMDASGIWTHIWDMHGGGNTKTDCHHIFIQPNEEDAMRWANWKWSIHPYDVTCSCCGNDFSIDEGQLGDLAAFHFTKSDEYDKKLPHDIKWKYVIPQKEVAKRMFMCIINGGDFVNRSGAEEKKFALFVFANKMGNEYKSHIMDEPICDYYDDDDDDGDYNSY